MAGPQMRGPGGRRGMMGGKRSKNPKKTLGRLMKYIQKGYGVQFVVVLICILLSAVANVAGSMFLKSLIDDYISPLLLQASPVFTGLLHALMSMAVIYLIGIATTFIYNWLMVSISQGVLKKVRDEMFAHMQKLPIRYFDTHTHGDLMSHFTNDTDTLQQMLSQSVPQMFSSAMTIISVFIGMLVTNVWLTLFVLLGVCVMLKVVKKLGGQSAKYFLEQQKSLGRVNGYIEEMINGQKVIKVFCHEEKCKEQFDALNDELRENAASANTFANILMPIMMNIGNLLYVLVAVVGGALALSGVVGNSITIGVIASFLQLTKSFTQPVTQISQQFNSIVMALAGAERIFELMDEEPEVDNGYVTLVNAKYDKNGELVETPEKTNIWAWKHPHEDGTTTYTQVRGDVRFFDVDFGYNPDKIIVHDFSADVHDGQKVAIVGPTGAGKTTMVKLLMRFYDVNSGSIKVDGHDVKDFNRSELHEMFGMVLQDTWLFSGTIMENIRYGRLDATDEEVIAAAKAAHIHNFIMQQPGGYNMVLDEETSNVSQGQKQLLTIARAILADNKILILDEATSSVDTRTEVQIQKAMDNLMKGRTSFVIAHRLSTIRDADLILVMKDGDIIEQGSHEELLAKKGFYADLYNSQFDKTQTA